MTSILKVSVQELVGFVLKSGDLSWSFTGSTRAVEGTKAHKKIQKTRPEGYRAEVSLTYAVETDELSLEIMGRADGIFSEGELVIIEEIKSTFVPLEDLPEDYSPMHWAQAKCYAFIYALQNELEQIDVMLTYFNLDTEESKCFRKAFCLEELATFFDDLVGRYLHWAGVVHKWELKRDRSIREMEFPFSTYRRGQRELAVGVYKTVIEGSKLFAQAPTGIGKTIATLFPAVKAMGEGQVSKIFYLTAKTIAREIAEKALDKMRDRGLAFKTVTLTAKDKICFQDETNCDPEVCPYARGYYDRINAAVEDIYRKDDFTRAAIEEHARKHEVCPFEYSLDLALWSDCIVCDYNYVFDPQVYLRRFFLDEKGDYCFLIDEAHNLVDRAREMFSAEVVKRPFLDLKRATKGVAQVLYEKIDAINNFMIQARKQCDNEGQNYVIQKDPPGDLLYLLREFAEVADKWLARNHGALFYQELLDLYFEVNAFIRIAEFYDERYVTYIDSSWDEVKVKMFCLDPSLLLKEAIKRGRAAIFFSATLTPLDYFADILGGEEEDHKFRVASPFLRDNLCLLAADHVKTTFHAREMTYDKIVEAVGAMIEERVGNYLVYLPSYKYMNEVCMRFMNLHPHVRVIYQTSGMSEEERENYLAQFTLDNHETLVGFAVMGGVFGEGIDLTGERLSGTAIVGVGLPQICLERDIIREYFAEKNEMGFEYAYVYPGMNKVLQAAGRVIRTETDRGVVLLIDERFAYSGYKDLFPREWHPVTKVRTKEAIQKALKDFW